MSNTCVTVSCNEWISTVVIDDPPDNHLSRDVLADLNRTVSEVHGSQADLRVVLFTAKGRNFSRGIDYDALAKMTKRPEWVVGPPRGGNRCGRWESIREAG